MPRTTPLYTAAMNQCPPPGFGGSLVNQSTRNRPAAELLMRNVIGPLTSFAAATVVIESRFAAVRVAELPTSSFTSAPGTDPNVTRTERKVTGFPMSSSRPAPAFRPPNVAVLYHWESHADRMLGSIAFGAYCVFSLLLSSLALLSGSNPVARTGTSVVTDVVGTLFLAR